MRLVEGDCTHDCQDSVKWTIWPHWASFLSPSLTHLTSSYSRKTVKKNLHPKDAIVTNESVRVSPSIIYHETREKWHNKCVQFETSHQVILFIVTLLEHFFFFFMLHTCLRTQAVSIVTALETLSPHWSNDKDVNSDEDEQAVYIFVSLQRHSGR